MTERIAEAADEIRPLLEEFIMWAAEHAPEAEAELMGSAALWHRLSASDSAVHWTREQLRKVLLELYPRAVEDPERAIAGTLPAVRAYLTFLSTTGRLRGDSLDTLLPELRQITPEFARALLDYDAVPDLDEDWGDWDDWDIDLFTLGDFADFADEIEAVPTIRLAPLPELAAAARQVPTLARACQYAREVESLANDHDEDDDDPLWHLATEAGFLDPMTETLTSLAGDWPDVADDAAVTAWAAGLAEVVLTDVDGEGIRLLEEDFDGFGQEMLIRLLLAEGPVPLARLKGTLHDVLTDRGEDGEVALMAADDVVGGVLATLSDYGAVSMSGDAAELTPLGLFGVTELAEEAGAHIDARPATESMTAVQALGMSTTLPEEEAKAEFDAWLTLRSNARAAEELLEAAARVDIVHRVEAVRRVDDLWPDSEPALRDALDVPQLRPYAATQLQQRGAAGSPEPSKTDMQWMTLDVWKISLDLGKEEFLAGLGSPSELIALLDEVWRVPHPDIIEVLEAVARLHPEKAVSKAARRALFRTRSARS